MARYLLAHDKRKIFKKGGRMDNLYGQYYVSGVEVVEVPANGDRPIEVYKVDLSGDNGHNLSFSLILKNVLGKENPDVVEVFNYISPHIRVGELLHIEFALRFRRDSLALCMVGFMKCSSRRVSDGAVMNPRDFSNPNRGYWAMPVPSGEWIYPPHGLIELGGQSQIPMDLGWGWPKFCRYSEIGKSEYALTWQKKLEGIKMFLYELLR